MSRMDANLACRVIRLARLAKEKDKARAQWNALHPFMIMKQIEYKSFNEYFDLVTGRNIDTRSAEEILEEVYEIRKEIEGQDGSV